MSAKVVLLNANSAVCRQKCHELPNFLPTHKSDFLLLNKTKLNPRHKFYIPNYTTFRFDRTASVGGGTAILEATPFHAQQIIVPAIIAAPLSALSPLTPYTLPQYF